MAKPRAKRYKKIAVAYARAAVAGEINVGAEVVAAAQRFLDDLERKDLTLRTRDADFVCNIVERIMVHKQGQTLDGTPLTNTPLRLLPWQVFIIYNLLGFYYKGRRERRYKEAFIYVPRKNGKTLFAAALAFGIALLERRSGVPLKKQECIQNRPSPSLGFGPVTAQLLKRHSRSTSPRRVNKEVRTWP